MESSTYVETGLVFLEEWFAFIFGRRCYAAQKLCRIGIRSLDLLQPRAAERGRMDELSLYHFRKQESYFLCEQENPRISILTKTRMGQESPCE